MQFFPQENNPEKDYNYYVQKMEEARQRLSLGGRTIGEDFNDPSFKDRWDERLRAFNIISNPYSSFSANEQLHLARLSLGTSSIMRGADLGFGAMNLGSMALPGGMVTGAAVSAGIGGMRYGFQESFGDPFVNSRMFSTSALLSSRESIGGLTSNTGVGGLSAQQSMGFGRLIEDTFRRGNTNMNAEQINQIVSSAGSMPQLQFVGNVDQAVQNMSKYVEVLGKLVKQLGPDKLGDILTSMKQFGSMGMSVAQSETAFNTVRNLGASLNTDPGRIMSFGVGSASQFMGTNISQATGFNWGVSNLNSIERLRQSGALLPQQLLNFGGPEGVAQRLTDAQSRFMQNPISDIFLKSMYSGGLSPKDIQSGNFSLQDARYSAANITMNPNLNMSYGFDKDMLISQFDDPRAASYQMMNKLFSQGSPFGSGLSGRSRWLQATGIAQDKQTARLMAQDWMGTDPLGQLDGVQDKYQRDQFMAGQETYFSSGTSTGRFLSGMGRDISRGLTGLRRDTYGFIPGADTQQGAVFDRNIMNLGQSYFGTRDAMDWIMKSTTPGDIIGNPFKPMEKERFRSAFKEMGSSDIDASMRTRELARSMLYANQEVAMDDITQDRVRDVRRIVKDRYSNKFKPNLGADEIQSTTDEIYQDFSRNFQYSGLDDEITMRGGFKGRFGELVKGVIAKEVAGDSSDNLLKQLSKESPVSGLNIPTTSGTTRLLRQAGTLLGGPLGVALIPGIQEDMSNENYRSIQQRLMSSDVDTQKKMIDYMQQLSQSPDGSIRPDAQKMGWFGGIKSSDLAGFYNQYGSQLSDLNDPAKLNSMRIKEDAEQVRTSIHALFSSPGYKDALNRSNLPTDLLEKLTYAASGDQSALNGVVVDPDAYNKFAKSFAGAPGGIGTLLNKMTKVGDDGSLSVETGTQRSEKYLDETQVLMQKKFGDNDRWKNAQEIWDGKRFSEAKTIQDHATATAKGLEIYFGSGEKSQWNKAFNNSDKA